MLDPGEPTVICPYERAHVLLKSRVQTHLTKCRLQHPNLEKAVCPYNATHIINKLEMPFHTEQCPDRRNVEIFVYNVGNRQAPPGILPVRNIPIDTNTADDEDWDTCASTSVLDTIKETARQKPILINKIGASKAVRKAHRNEERTRYEKYLQSEKGSK